MNISPIEGTMDHNQNWLKRLWWLPALIILADQATKLRVRHFMDLGESFSVWGDFFRITYVTNTGAAFSMRIGSANFDRVFFIVTSLLALSLLIYLITKSKELLSAISYSLIIGGAVGNLIDRIVHGAVIDFLDFDFFDFIIARWPVFNIADSMITIAVILLIVDTLISIKKTKRGITNPV